MLVWFGLRSLIGTAHSWKYTWKYNVKKPLTFRNYWSIRTTKLDTVEWIFFLFFLIYTMLRKLMNDEVSSLTTHLYEK